MEHQITIREAAAKEDVAVFWEQLHSYHKRDIFPDPEDEDRDYFLGAEYQSAIERGHDRLQDRFRYVFFHRDGQDIGFALTVIYGTEDGKCFIMEFCVYPQFRGGGAGRACARTLLAWAKANGATYAELNYGGDERRMRFWQSVGFVKNGADEWGEPLMLLPPAGNMFAGNMSARDMSAGDMSARDMSVGNMPAGNMPAGDMSAGDISAGDMAVKDVPAGDMAVRDVPVTVGLLSDPTDWQLRKLENGFRLEIGEQALTEEQQVCLAQAVRDGRITFFVARRGCRTIGMCSVSRCFSTFACADTGVLDDFYIEPVFRRKGVARRLTEAARNWCRENGMASVTVCCAPCDEGMYQSLGFDVWLGSTYASLSE